MAEKNVSSNKPIFDDQFFVHLHVFYKLQWCRFFQNWKNNFRLTTCTRRVNQQRIGIKFWLSQRNYGSVSYHFYSCKFHPKRIKNIISIKIKQIVNCKLPHKNIDTLSIKNITSIKISRTISGTSYGYACTIAHKPITPEWNATSWVLSKFARFLGFSFLNLLEDFFRSNFGRILVRKSCKNNVCNNNL